MYDKFGVDLGEEKPESAIWALSSSLILQPVGSFIMKATFAGIVNVLVMYFSWLFWTLFCLDA